MDYKAGIEVTGTIKKVESYGIFLTLDNNLEAFLPKEEMYVSKKKKLTDIFVEGYVIKAQIKSKKKDYYVVTQKNVEIKSNKIDLKNKDGNKVINCEKNSQHFNEKRHKTKKAKKLRVDQKNVEHKQRFEEDDREKQITLDSLRTMTKIGHLKISSSKKITKITNKVFEQEEDKEILEVPENFMEETVANFEKMHARFENVLEHIRTRGYWLDED